MSWPRRPIAALAVLVAVLAVALGPAGVSAAKKPHVHNPPFIPSSMSVGTSGSVERGQQAVLSVHLGTARGPVSGATVHVYINGSARSAFGLKTNFAGNAQYKFRRTLAVGTYSIVVVYRGSHPKGAQPTQASATLQVLPLGATILQFSPLPPVTTGQEAKVTVKLTDAGGTPLPHRAVHLLVAGKEQTRLVTAADGTATYRFSRATPAGGYALHAAFDGVRPRGLQPSSADATLTLMPMTLTVQTLPAVLGASVTVDNHPMTTDRNGKVVVPIASIGDHTFAVAAPAPNPAAQIAFAHWSDGTATSQRTVKMFGNQTAFAVFSVRTFTHINYIAADGSAVSPEAVRNLVISGPDGISQNLDGQTDVWLALPVPPRDSTSAGAKHPSFTTMSASVDGINVLNGGSNAFTPIAGAPWNIKLGLYTLDITIRHVVPGRTLGGTVRLVEAHGWSAEYKLGDDGHAVLRGLPRGNYTLTVLNGGYASSAPIALSRTQPVSLKLIDKLDLTIISAIAMWVLVAVLARPVYRRTPFARRRAAARR